MTRSGKRHFMIDLETMGIRPSSAIVSIGIAYFDEFEILDRFYTPITLASCIEVGLTTDQSTVDWWSRQSVEAKIAWQNDQAVPLTDGLKSMQTWMLNHSANNGKLICPWGNGADFDLVLLKSAFNALGAEPPWMYYNHHCYRTIKNLMPVLDFTRKGTYHHALDDAVSQAEHLQRILARYSIAL